MADELGEECGGCEEEERFGLITYGRAGGWFVRRLGFSIALAFGDGRSEKSV